jgi:hypothetical protein
MPAALVYLFVIPGHLSEQFTEWYFTAVFASALALVPLISRTLR